MAWRTLVPAGAPHMAAVSMAPSGSVRATGRLMSGDGRTGIDRGVAREQIVRRLTPLLERLSARRQVRHVVMGAADLDGSWGWSDSSGRATTDGAPMAVTTPFLLASVTKLYIAAVVLRLWEQQRLELSAAISTYLPDELGRGLHVLGGVDHTERITPAHLLGHLTGLPDWLDDRPSGGGPALIEQLLTEDRFVSLEDVVLHVRTRLTPHFAPSNPLAARTRIRYSDTNYQLLMLIVQHVTGQPMHEVYDQLLLRPLGLRHTWMPGQQPRERTVGPATVWMADEPLDRPLALRSFRDLYATVGDVLRFGRALFSGEVFDHAATADLLTRRFHRFGIPRGMVALRAPSWPIEYGWGVMRFKLSRVLAGGQRLPPLLGHTGSSGSWLWYAPTLRLLMAGTVDQTAAAFVPFRDVSRALADLPQRPRRHSQRRGG